MADISYAEVRMYKMGTGDCFAIKFMSGNTVKFKMLIDAGTWSGSTEKLTPYIEDLLEYLDHQVNVLIVTHEHLDHVHAFDACRDTFLGEAGLTADEIWMGWTENDKSSKVRRWKTDYGEKKMALSMAAQRMQSAVASTDYKLQYDGDPYGEEILGMREWFAYNLSAFAELHVSENALYKGGLKGMEVVKKELANDNIQYFEPGQIIENLPGADGLKFYVLGPPTDYTDVKKEKGKSGTGESYDHNDDIEVNNGFASAVVNYDNREALDRLSPFDPQYLEPENPTPGDTPPTRVSYNLKGKEWQKIDYDWLQSGGSLALRMNSKTNNLSLAIAIEFEDSGRVMLFPGDAEYGSWASWHKINWNLPSRNGKPHFTQDLLSRTVFYKVAHHLSHNGTAKKLGLEMMEDKNLVAMATLDYDVISSGWTGTMPNRDIVRDLIRQTKGRLMIMNTENLYLDFNNQEPLIDKITEGRRTMSKKEADEFKKYLKETELYIQYTIKGK